MEAMSLSGTLKRSFVGGLVLIAPLVITLYVLRLLVNWSLQFINPVVSGTRLTNYTANDQLLAQLLAVVLILGSITVLGWMAQRRWGQQLFGGFGRAIYFVPLISTIYTSIRQVADSLSKRDSQYDRVVLVEYPREGIYAIGLVTGEATGLGETEEPLYHVFLPNSPNPTGGRLAMVPESQLQETDLSVRGGIRRVITTGIGEE
jgi:uncharacterized membrane protein